MTDSLIFIIDISASVQSYIQSYLEIVHSIVQAQKNTNPNSLITCVLFNEQIQYNCINFPLNNIDLSFNINPKGLTAFYDNVSTIIHKLLNFYREIHQKAPTVVILTDGEDTCSKILGKRRISLQIALAKAEDWKFIYLGINEISLRIGREIGCDTCILYSLCTSKRLLEIMEKLFSDRNIPTIDIDLIDSLSSMKID